ncbi:MAG TPA: phosphotransferase family protein [Sphingopyxis sp.]|nr:phosphotransferase family protein [Sphingopyxis sp.]
MAGRSAEDVAFGVNRWAKKRFGKAATIQGVRDLGGHSGDTFAFQVVNEDATQSFVVRVAPAGVRHQGSTDVLRQAPLLRVLKASGIAVAEVIDTVDDSSLFDAPALIVSMLLGKPLIMGPDAGTSWMGKADRDIAHDVAAQQLAKINAVEFAPHLSDWEAVHSPEKEINTWLPFWEKSSEPSWKSDGRRLGEALLASVPTAWHLGICHGDFQLNNVLFDVNDKGIEIGGVVDWEVAHLGATEHDLAWFLMMNDKDAWHPVELRGVGVDLTRIVANYEATLGDSVPNLHWFSALSCYRIAAIACYNIRLHRTGRRLDDAWERASQSVPVLLRRAFDHLDGA